MQRYSMDAVVYDNVPSSSHKAPPGVEKRAQQPLRSRRSRSSRWRLALVVTAQNLLVALCLAVTLYVHWNAPQQKSNSHEGKGIYIRFEPVDTDPSTMSTKLKIERQKNNEVDVINNQINIKCTGPYILYMNVCYRGKGGNGILSLQVKGDKRNFTSVLPSLRAAADEEECTGLHKVVHLSQKDSATLHFNSSTNLQITSIDQLGLTYLLGSYCYF